MPTKDFADKAENLMRAETGEHSIGAALNATSEQDMKAIGAINKASELVDEAVELLVEKRTGVLDLKLWQMAAELEYASFLISVNHRLADYLPSLSDVDQNTETLDSLIVRTQETLENVATILLSNPKDAYDRAKKATTLIRRAQSILRKTDR